LGIFLANNPELKTNETIDLHGLHVKEAIAAVKQLISTKKQG
jgi:hypothetical protein